MGPFLAIQRYPGHQTNIYSACLHYPLVLRTPPPQGRVWLSPIFDWFSTDFEAAGGALAFASHYVSTEDRAWIRAHDPQMDYFDYDWSLNDWPRSQ